MYFMTGSDDLSAFISTAFLSSFLNLFLLIFLIILSKLRGSSTNNAASTMYCEPFSPKSPLSSMYICLNIRFSLYRKFLTELADLAMFFKRLINLLLNLTYAAPNLRQPACERPGQNYRIFHEARLQVQPAVHGRERDVHDNRREHIRHAAG